MAFDNSTVAEIRTTGVDTNGGGFANVTPGTSVDYSQQDAAQLQILDGTTDAAGTKLTSITGGFTAAMEGNVLYARNGVDVQDFYQIPTGGYIDGNNVMLDRSAGANKINIAVDLGGAWKWSGNPTIGTKFETAWWNKVWVKAGTYAACPGIAFQATIGPLVRRIIGYKVSRGDMPLDTDRPFIDLAAGNLFLLTGFQSLENMRVRGDRADVIQTGGGCAMFNCDIENLNLGLNTRGVNNITQYFYAMACKAKCAAGAGAGAAAWRLNSGAHVMACVGKDAERGFWAEADKDFLAFCIARNCSYGFYFENTSDTAFNCLAYDCDDGFYSIMNNAWQAFVNSIGHGNTRDFKSSQASEQEGIMTFFNCIDGVKNFTMVRNWYNNIIGDPGLRDPANDDYRVDSMDHNVYQQALELSQFTGVKV